MTTPNEHTPGEDTGTRPPAADYPRPSRRRPPLSGRDIMAVSSLIFIIAAAALYAFTGAENPFPKKNPVHGPLGRDILTIDGTRNGSAVTFSHKGHLSHVASGQEGCVTCHHLAKPGAGPSSCSGCHSDMNRTSAYFNHDGHIGLMKESGSCSACHTGDRSRKNIRPCGACHEGYAKKIEDYRSAPGYKDALHELCYRCHGSGGTKTGDQDYCATCHRGGTIPR